MAPVVKNLPANADRYEGCRFNPWVGKIPWRRARPPTLVFSPRESYGQRSLAGYSPARVIGSQRVQLYWSDLARTCVHAVNKKERLNSFFYQYTYMKGQTKFSNLNCRVWGIEMHPQLLAPLHASLLAYGKRKGFTTADLPSQASLTCNLPSADSSLRLILP